MALAASVGCGMAAAPQPPSLGLPRPVKDLTASRAANDVTLHWETPKQTTDGVKLRGPVKMQICRQQAALDCSTVATVLAAPGRPAAYTDVLPAALATGLLRPVTYQVAGLNRHGRNAGASNGAMVLAGAAPPQVAGLTATVVERGVILHWVPTDELPPDTFVRLERTLVAPAGVGRKSPGASSRQRAAESVPQTLVVAVDSSARPAPPSASEKGPPTSRDPGTALDPGVTFDQTYRYVATRVTQKRIDQQLLRVSSAPSQPVVILVQDRFPPKPPERLAAIPVSAAINGGHPEIDLSWSPSPEPDFAQYRVYRQDITAHGAMKRVAPGQAAGANHQPLEAPAFRDTDVEPDHQYLYSVSAVDADGNESARSAAVEATVPAS